MAVKTILVLCATALMMQSTQSACLGGCGAPYGLGGLGYGYNGFAYDGFAGPYEAGFGYGYGPGYGYGAGCGVASTGGGLPVASSSPIPPVGVSVLSENVYEGALAVGGNLPFLGTVAVEGMLPTAGAGAVSYGCGNAVGIAAEEGVIATGIAPHVPGPYGFGAYGPYNGFGGLGYGYGGYGYGAGCGCGCGAIY